MEYNKNKLVFKVILNINSLIRLKIFFFFLTGFIQIVIWNFLKIFQIHFQTKQTIKSQFYSQQFKAQQIMILNLYAFGLICF
jgi:hypothetical protein